MGKKKKLPTAPRTRWKPAGRVILVLGLIAGMVLLFNLLGGEAIRRIGQNDRYRVRFADILCDAPRGQDRAAFLTEVRYLSGFPEVFHALDESDRRRLTDAFARHPWVESVDAVDVEPGNAVRVKLFFRQPLLLVRTDRGAVRMVDAKGVLLPETAPPDGLGELVIVVPSPAVSAGEVWSDELVQRAIQIAKGRSVAKLERTADAWRITLRDGTQTRE